MRALATPELRTRQMRRFAWLLAPVLSFSLSYVLVMARLPGAPYWLGFVIGAFVTPLTGVLLSRALVNAASDMLVVRLGSLAERQQRLAAPSSRFVPTTTRAALALETGDLARVAPLLGSLALIEKQGLFFCVTQRHLLAIGDPATQERAIVALLAWKGPTVRLGFLREVVRYHAFVLASALATRAPSDALVRTAAQRLRADRDFEVRAYATWLAEDADALAEADARDLPSGSASAAGRRDDDAHLLAGAALARASGREPLAQRLELRAARLAPSPRAPYRAG